jgi:hypothetical protein
VNGGGCSQAWGLGLGTGESGLQAQDREA